MANTVTFYHMKGCGHCVEFNKKWEAVTDQLKDMGYQPRKVDANSQEAREAIKNKIISGGFPTTVAMKNGKVAYTIRGNDAQEPGKMLKTLGTQSGGNNFNFTNSGKQWETINLDSPSSSSSSSSGSGSSSSISDAGFGKKQDQEYEQELGNTDEYYKMKYFKYKSKYLKLASQMR